MEYLSKNEVKPHRLEFQVIIEKVRKTIKESDITFTCTLIGSSKRNLVLEHHNKGYDCDYKINIQKNEQNLKPKKIKHLFIDAFNEIVVPLGYNHCEDSTQSITFRKIVQQESKVEKGFDVIITKCYDDGVHILRNEKHNKPDDYHFTLMKDTSKFHEQYKQINGYVMWQDLRVKYKKKREDNNELSESQQKKGFQLLSDTVNEIVKN